MNNKFHKLSTNINFHLFLTAIDVLKQMLRRIQTNFINEPQLLGKKVWGGKYLNVLLLYI